jgi:hypothetical protein
MASGGDAQGADGRLEEADAHGPGGEEGPIRRRHEAHLQYRGQRQQRHHLQESKYKPFNNITIITCDILF